MEPSVMFKNLAQVLKLRRQASGRPYTLLLTSSLSLGPAMRRRISGLEYWVDFRDYLRQFAPHDRMLALQPLLQEPQHHTGYLALAQLIKQGYFGTILTTNIDSVLEDALFEVGFKPSDFQLIVVERYIDEYVVQALESSTALPRIVKLRGSLRDSIIPDTFPDVFELRDGLRESVQRQLNQDLLVVGTLEHEYELVQVLRWNSRDSIYYVTEQAPERDDVLLRIVEARGWRPEQRVFAGRDGEMDRFFPQLVSLLEGHDSVPPSPIARGAQPVQSSVELRPEPNPQTQAAGEAVLLVTVTEIETRAVRDVGQREYGLTFKRHVVGDKTYYDLGKSGGVHLYLVQSEMGASGPGSSLLTVSEGIQVLKPSAVIMVGIAFGFNADKLSIGDILVSQSLQSYEQQRLGSGPDGRLIVLPRGDRASATIRLIDRFRSGVLDWSGSAHVHFGLVLSGEKLVDNKEFRDQLRALFPEALGGEMEGTGLYAVAQRYKKDWILVKAVCDWADGNKGANKQANQTQAATNAARFVLHVIQNTQLY